MTPKEKAKELVQKHYTSIFGTSETKEKINIAKMSAIITVGELIKNSISMDNKWHDNEDAPLTSIFNYDMGYWKDVQKEISLL